MHNLSTPPLLPLLILLLLPLVTANLPMDLVETDAGLLRGHISPSEGYRSFKGIPYAEAPTGERRWKPPVEKAPWGGVRNATQWGNHCPQYCSLPNGFCPRHVDEDCLQLNVFTPIHSTDTDPLPVFVFIPGGHFDAGGAGVVAYDGRFLARKGVIVVTINYRLGVLGFMVNKDHGIEGNYGSMDQILALKWVQRNIRAFGGDPDRVTLGGESAGATSVSTFQTAPVVKGLFHQAIIQSNPFSLVLLERKHAHKLGKTVAKELKCKDLACLQKTPWEILTKVQDKVGSKPNFLHPIFTLYPWTPVPDGVYCTGQPIDEFAEGKFHEMPVLMGSLSEEAKMFVHLAIEKPASKLIFNAIKAALFLWRYKDVNAMYPSISGDNRIPLSHLATDYIFTAPTRNIALNIVNFSKSPVFLFQFNHSLSFDEAWLPGYPFCRGHVCHGSELPFAFNTSRLIGFEPTPTENRLVDVMTTYWTNFIKTGDPSQGLPVQNPWPAFSTENMVNIQLESDNIHVKKNLESVVCDFWDKLGYKFGWNLLRGLEASLDDLGEEDIFIMADEEMN